MNDAARFYQERALALGVRDAGKYVALMLEAEGEAGQRLGAGLLALEQPRGRVAFLGEIAPIALFELSCGPLQAARFMEVWDPVDGDSCRCCLEPLADPISKLYGVCEGCETRRCGHPRARIWWTGPIPVRG